MDEPWGQCQPQKDKYCVLSLKCGTSCSQDSWKPKVAWDCQEGELGVTSTRPEVLEPQTVAVTQRCDCTWGCWTVHWEMAKMVNFTFCVLYSLFKSKNQFLLYFSSTLGSGGSESRVEGGRVPGGRLLPLQSLRPAEAGPDGSPRRPASGAPGPSSRYWPGRALGTEPPAWAAVCVPSRVQQGGHHPF